MNSRKVGFYLIPTLLVAGLGTFFFVYQSAESPEISSEENSKATVEQPQRLSGQSITTVLNNESALPQKKHSVQNTVKKTAVVSSTAPSEQRKRYSQQSTAEQEVTVNEEFFNAVGQYTDLELLEQLEDALWGDSELVVQDQVMVELTERLRKTADSAITDRIAELLASNALSDEQQASLLSFLGKLGTQDAIKALTSLIPQLNDGAGKEQLAQVFSDLGNTQWDAGMFAKNPHPLEEAWKMASDDEVIKGAVADAIAGIGTTNGIDLLLKSLDDDSTYSEENAQAIGNSLAKTSDSEAIQLLGETLRRGDSRSRAAYVAGYALAHNNQEQSIRVLLDWTSNASGGDSVLVEEWLRAAVENNPTAINLLLKESVNKKFDSPEVETTVTTLRSEYESI
ncbi:MAG: hypothetical protein SD837_20305 [Candidatus Electrothrix scaldis]|jgi:hypothetical protein|nr:MAG: hypothetical protein SD837_20305 [Candidatus Electrothrix sp. GW3-3]